MKFAVGDLVRLKNKFMRPSTPVGVVLEYWPVEHSEHGYIYSVVSVSFGTLTLDLGEEDFELVSKIVEKRVDRGSLP